MSIDKVKLAFLVVPISFLKEKYDTTVKVDELIELCDQLKARLTNAQTTQIRVTDAIVEQAV